MSVRKPILLAISLVFVAILVGMAACGKAEPAFIEWVPEDGKYLGRIKSRAALADSGLQDIGIVESMFDVARVLDVGIDLKDFTEIWTFGEFFQNGAEERYVGMILVGDVQEGKLLNAIQNEGKALTAVNYKDAVIHTTEDGKTALSFLGAGAYVIGSISAVQDVIDVRRGDKRAINGKILDNFTSQGDRLLSLALEVPPGGLDTTLEPFRSIETVGFLVDKLDQNIFIEVSVDFSNESSASEAAEVIDAVVGLAKTLGGDESRILQETEVSALGTVMTINLATTVTEIAKLGEAAQERELEAIPGTCQPDIGQLEERRSMELGFRTIDPGPPATVQPFPVEALMITGDLNIVDVQLVVQYCIKDLDDFLYNVADPEGSPGGRTLRDAAEASVRKVVGQRTMDGVLTEERAAIENATKTEIQRLMDLYGTGILIELVQFRDVKPPSQVQAAFDDVVAAREDKQRLINEAQAYASDIIPRARGEAELIIIDAETSSALRIIQAEEEADRFVSILREYDQEGDEAFKALYLDSLEDILPGITEFILASQSGLNRSVPNGPDNDFVFAGLWGSGFTVQAILASHRWSEPEITASSQNVGFASVQAQLIFINQFFFMLQETNQAVVRRFGEVERVHQVPSVYLKVPFVEDVILYDKRILRFDAPPIELITNDKQFLVIDAYGRYQIVDPKRFFESLRGDITAADARLGEIINGELRKQIALFDQADIIKTERDNIERTVTLDSDRKTFDPEGEEGLGIRVIDVRMKRIDSPPAIAQAVFNRMIAERQREAAQFRAEGAEADFRIRADADRQRAIILAEAQRQANIITAEAEARAIDLIIQALAEDPDLSRYQSALEAYKISKGLGD